MAENKLAIICGDMKTSHNVYTGNGGSLKREALLSQTMLALAPIARKMMEVNVNPSDPEPTAEMRNAVLSVVSEGLVPGQDAYLIPFVSGAGKNRKVTITTIISFRAYLKRFAAAGIMVYPPQAICQNDTFKAPNYAYDGSDYKETWSLTPATTGNRGEVIGAIVAYRLPDGNTSFVYVDKARLDVARSCSKSKVWDSHPVEMAKKTAIRALAKVVMAVVPEVPMPEFKMDNVEDAEYSEVDIASASEGAPPKVEPALEPPEEPEEVDPEPEDPEEEPEEPEEVDPEPEDPEEEPEEPEEPEADPAPAPKKAKKKQAGDGNPF